MARVTSYHLYKDCYMLEQYLSSHTRIGLWDNPTAFTYDWKRQTCRTCRQRAADCSDEIDDFNSVWFGMGPDMLLQPVKAGSNVSEGGKNLRLERRILINANINLES
jgi:hypothetical protein